MFKKVISLALSVVFSLQTCGFAQAGQLNLAGYLGQGSGVPALDIFRPAHLRYFSYEPDSDNFQILLDKADEKDLSDGQVKDKADELMKYFRIGLSLPNDKFWVNLRPDAPEQIIDPALEQTDMGKIMLEADLQLKKDTSSLTSPQTKEGKEYWDKLYKKAGELFGTENITIPTITRPWIVPGEIIVRQSGSSAYIYKAALKVMLEEDYLRGMKDERRGTTTDYNFPDPRMKELNKYSTQLIRELIIPQLTKEVNRAKRYAGLRQVFYSLILARWFKQGYQNSGASERQGTRAPVNGNNTLAKLIDSGSLTNLTSREPWSKDTYYQGYKKSFEQGEYNLSQTVHTPTGQLIRRYVSGGISAGSALEVNDHFDVGKVNNGIPVVGYKGVFFDGNSVEITVSSGIESKKPKVLTIKKFAHVFNEISWPDIGTVYSYSLESNPELGRRIVILRNNDGSSSKEADNRIVIRYGDRVLPSDIIGFINSKLISYLNRYINRHLTLPQHKIDDYRKSDYSKHLSEPLKIIEAIKKAEIYASSALTLDEAKSEIINILQNINFNIVNGNKEGALFRLNSRGESFEKLYDLLSWILRDSSGIPVESKDRLERALNSLKLGILADELKKQGVTAAKVQMNLRNINDYREITINNVTLKVEIEFFPDGIKILLKEPRANTKYVEAGSFFLPYKIPYEGFDIMVYHLNNKERFSIEDVKELASKIATSLGISGASSALTPKERMTKELNEGIVLNEEKLERKINMGGSIDLSDKKLKKDLGGRIPEGILANGRVVSRVKVTIADSGGASYFELITVPTKGIDSSNKYRIFLWNDVHGVILDFYIGKNISVLYASETDLKFHTDDDWHVFGMHIKDALGISGASSALKLDEAKEGIVYIIKNNVEAFIKGRIKDAKDFERLYNEVEDILKGEIIKTETVIKRLKIAQRALKKGIIIDELKSLGMNKTQIEFSCSNVEPEQLSYTTGGPRNEIEAMWGGNPTVKHNVGYRYNFELGYINKDNTLQVKMVRISPKVSGIYAVELGRHMDIIVEGQEMTAEYVSQSLLNLEIEDLKDLAAASCKALGISGASSALTLDEAKGKVLGAKNEFRKILQDNKGDMLWKNRNLDELFDEISKETNPELFVKQLQELIEVLKGKKKEFENQYEGMRSYYLQRHEVMEAKKWHERGKNVSDSYDIMLDEFKKISGGLISGASSALIGGKLTKGQISLLEMLLPSNNKLSQDAIDIINRFLSCPVLYPAYLNGLENKMYLSIGRDDLISDEYADVYITQDVKGSHSKREIYFLALSRDLLISALLFKAYPKAVWNKKTIKEVKDMLHSSYDFDEDLRQRIKSELNLDRIDGTEIASIIKDGGMLKRIDSLIAGKVEEVLNDYNNEPSYASLGYPVRRLRIMGIEEEENVLYAVLIAYQIAYRETIEIEKEIQLIDPNYRVNNYEVVSELAPLIAEYLIGITDYSATVVSVRLLTILAPNLTDEDFYRYSITSDYAKNLLELAKNKYEQVSSALTSEDRSSSTTITSVVSTILKFPGGIDFRQMNMLIQPQGSFRGLDFSPAALSGQALEAMDLDKDLEGINRMTLGRRRTHPQRLKEYISACIFKGKIDEKADDFILSMLEVFQLQTEEGIESASQDREAVVLADTRRYVLPEKRLAASNSYSLN